MDSAHVVDHAYHGLRWVKARLPEIYQPWLWGEQRSLGHVVNHQAGLAELAEAMATQAWHWPQQPVIFISDIHADTDAFIDSLVASGGIAKTGFEDNDFQLTDLGQNALFVIGGDCLDKGPSNLRLLRTLKHLQDKGAQLRLLAGNHDVRMMLGFHSVGLPDDPRTDHFFVRLGGKVVPFLKELVDESLDESAMCEIPDEESCRQQLLPGTQWFSMFPRVADGILSDAVIAKEVRRIKEKQRKFQQGCDELGLSMRQVYGAVMKWQQLFVEPEGEFYWFFDQMKLLEQQGSFLFLHAGLDDTAAHRLAEEGVLQINLEYRKLLQANLFEFYYGALANTMRTKYRDSDRTLSRDGVKQLHKAGIHVLVHGHQKRHHGQRIMMRKGMVNFECDISLDRATRRKEGLQGLGAGATVFYPNAVALGVSADHEAIKVFDAASVQQKLKGDSA